MPGTNNENTQSIEQDKYLNQIVKLNRRLNSNLLNLDLACSVTSHTNSTANTNIMIKSAGFDSNTLLTACNPISSSSNNTKLFTNTPTTNRRSLFASKIEKAVNTIKNINMNANNNASVSSCSSENINPVNSYNLPHNFNNHLVNNSNLLIICFLLI